MTDKSLGDIIIKNLRLKEVGFFSKIQMMTLFGHLYSSGCNYVDKSACTTGVNKAYTTHLTY